MTLDDMRLNNRTKMIAAGLVVLSVAVVVGVSRNRGDVPPPVTSLAAGDDTAPDLSFDQPDDSDKANVTVTGTVIDVDSGIDTVTVNGKTCDMVDNAAWSCDIHLHKGDNVLTAIATDIAGNQSEPHVKHVTYK